MEELPPLPDTDDPFALLGVTPEAGERDIKRAYVRLIKRYRPEKAPQEFQRIRDAYELARCRPLRFALVGFPDGPEQDHDDGEVEAAEVADRALDETEDDELNEEPGSDEPEPGWRWNDDDELVGRLAAGESVPAALLWGEERDDLDRVLLREELGWSALRLQPERGLALILLDRRLQGLAAEGRFGDLVAESEALLSSEHVMTEPDLECVVLQRLPAAIWDRPAEVARLFARYDDVVSDEGIENSLLCYERLVPLAEYWALFAPRHQVPKEFSGFLKVAPVLDYHYLRPLAARLRARLRGQPEVILRVFEDLQEGTDGSFVEFVDFLELLAEAAPPWQPSIEELPDNEVEELRFTVLDINTCLKSPPYLALTAVAIFVGSVVPDSLGIPQYTPHAMAAGPLLIGAFWFRGQHRLYKRFVRPRLTQLAATHGTAPAHVLRWLEEFPSESRRVRNLIPAIDSDEALGALAQLGRLLRHFDPPQDLDDE